MFSSMYSLSIVAGFELYTFRTAVSSIMAFFVTSSTDLSVVTLSRVFSSWRGSKWIFCILSISSFAFSFIFWVCSLYWINEISFRGIIFCSMSPELKLYPPTMWCEKSFLGNGLFEYSNTVDFIISEMRFISAFLPPESYEYAVTLLWFRSNGSSFSSPYFVFARQIHLSHDIVPAAYPNSKRTFGLETNFFSGSSSSWCFWEI